MEKEKLPCDTHTEQIKTLFKRVDEMNDIQKTLYSLDKSYALQSQLLQNIVEHNKKQDERMDKQQEVIEKINVNLTELTEGQKRTNEELKSLGNRMDNVEDKVDTNEEKHKIDWRDMVKGFLIKVAIPTGILLGIIELVKSKI